MTYDDLQVVPVWREPLGAAYLANHLAMSWIEVLKLLLTTDSIASSMLPIRDMNQSIIWQWNKDLPPTIDMCLHDVIASRVEKQPHIPAVSSWDGNFTYGEVHRYSTLVANRLIRLGVSIGDIIPLYFNKSKWTIVSVLAVMKAGAAFVLIEPSYPSQRKEIIISQIQAKLVLTSAELGPSLQGFAPNLQVQIIDDDTLSSLVISIDATTKLPMVPPNSLLYVIFTSGSTGVPKGVKINHATYTTSVLARSTPIGYSNDSRVLDFTSYAFDVSIDSMLCTLVRGGCLCIPSDEDRVNDLSHVIRQLRVNMINITPSVARILDPDIMPSLRSLGIGGEACSVRDVQLWSQYTRVVVGYGPSECTIGCTVNPNAAGKPYISIGPGTGAVIWLVDPSNHNVLSPIGAVGELLVEGPLVGQGYLNDAERTSASFIHDPSWLLEGGGGVPGRRGVLYKTGDLVRYDPDGQRGFIFVGRKDTQIKLRGQRIELSEIEHHMKLLLPGADAVADIISRNAVAKDSLIVAFIADMEGTPLEKEDTANKSGTVQVVEMSPRLAGFVHSMKDRLAKALPSYMLPTKYISVAKIPMLVSGKIDRKSLRALGENTVEKKRSL
jgi:amino acid adenylation domain-containing protein